MSDGSANPSLAQRGLSSFFTGRATLDPESKVLEDYRLGPRLGEGAYGSVYQVTHIPSGREFALKILQKEDFLLPSCPAMLDDCGDTPMQGNGSGDDGTFAAANLYETVMRTADTLEARIIQEAKVMQSLQHPHVVQFYKFLNSVDAFYFVMELASGGELFDLIISSGHFTEDQARHHFQELISAIDYCHGIGVAHKDLKAENLLLSSDGRLLVCDFGFSSKTVKEDIDDPEKGAAAFDTLEDQAVVAAQFGTLHYTSPEAVTAAATNMYEASPMLPEQPSLRHLHDATDSCPTSPTVTSGPGAAPRAATVTTADAAAPACASPTASASNCGSPVTTHPRSTSAATTGMHSGGAASKSHGAPSHGTSAHSHHHHGGLGGKMGTFMKSIMGGAGGMKHVKSTGAFSEVSTDESVDSAHAAAKLRPTPSEASLSAALEANSKASKKAAHEKKEKEKAKKEKEKEREREKEKEREKTKADTFLRAAAADVSSPASSAPPAPPPAPKKVIVDLFMQDLWSAGVILFFMLTGRLPFDGRDDEETLHLIQNCEFHFTEEETQRISPGARRLLVGMLAADPSDRLTLQQIMEDEWFTVNIDYARDFPHRQDLIGAAAAAGDGSSGATTANNTNADGTARTSHCNTPNASLPSAPSSTFLDFSSAQHVVTSEEEKVLDSAFHKIDCEGYGRITRDQVRDTLTTLRGHCVGKEDVEELLMLLTGSRDSKEVTFDQFHDAWVKGDLAHQKYAACDVFQLRNICGTHMDETERKLVRQLRVAFNSVDTEGTGVIRADQLRAVFERSHFPVHDGDLRTLMSFFLQEAGGGSRGAASHDGPSSPTQLGNPRGSHHFSEADPSSPLGSPTSASPTSNARYYSNMYVGDTVPAMDPSQMTISFDRFVNGIVRKEILLRHPLGRRLAVATNIASLFQSRNVKECLRHGFIVTGLQNVILEKLAGTPERLTLLYSDETVSETQNIYSFRYLGSSALLNGKSLEGPSARRTRMASSADGHRDTPPSLLQFSLSARDFGASLGGAAAAAASGEEGTAPPPLNSNAGALINQQSFSIGDFMSQSRAGFPLAGSPGANSLCRSFARHHRQQRAGAVGNDPLSQRSRSGARRDSEGAAPSSPESPVPPMEHSVAATRTHSTHSRAVGSHAAHDDDDNHDHDDDGHDHLDDPVAGASGHENSGHSGHANMMTPSRQQRNRRRQERDDGADTCEMHGSSRNSSCVLFTNEPTPRSDADDDASVSSDTARPAPPQASKHEQHQEQHQEQHRDPSPSGSGKNGDDEVKANGSRPAAPSAKPPTSPAHTKQRPPLAIQVGSPLASHTSRAGPAAAVASAFASKIPARRLASYSGPSLRGTPQLHVFSPLLQSPGVATSPTGVEGAAAASCAAALPTISATHRALAYGTGAGAVVQVTGVCDVDLILSPAGLGYTYIQFRRIHGKTSDFHEAVAYISNLLDDERQQAVEDTMTRGESELM